MTDEQINDLRRRIDAGEQVPVEEIMAGLAAIRQVRVNAPTVKAKKAETPTIKIDFAATLAKLKKPQTNP